MSLQIKDIQCYLDSKLQLAIGDEWDSDDHLDKRGTLVISPDPYSPYDYGIGEIVNCEKSIVTRLGIVKRKVKPILRPMSSLYTPLEDGSIPIVELAKIALSPYLENIDGYGLTALPDDDKHFKVVAFKGYTPIFDMMYENDLVNGFVIMERSTEIIVPVANQQELFDYLDSKLFDRRDLIGKGYAVSKNDVEI